MPIAFGNLFSYQGTKTIWNVIAFGEGWQNENVPDGISVVEKKH